MLHKQDNNDNGQTIQIVLNFVSNQEFLGRKLELWLQKCKFIPHSHGNIEERLRGATSGSEDDNSQSSKEI